jgi:hypothetical protein
MVRKRSRVLFDVAEVLGPTLTPESVLPGAEQKMNGSLLIAEATSIEEVKKIVEGDAYYVNDIVSRLVSGFRQLSADLGSQWDKEKIIITPMILIHPK